MNPWLKRKVLNFAHQGGAKEAPSSTLYAMELALKNGADALELDVHISKDGVLVVMHDEDVQATTDSEGLIRDLTLNELKSLDNAFKFSFDQEGQAKNFPYRGLAKKDNKFRVALLEEVFKSFPNTFINLDIKENLGYEQSLVQLIKKYHMDDKVIVASFHHECLVRFRLIAREIATSASPIEVASFYQSFKNSLPVKSIEFVALQIPHYVGKDELVTKDFVSFAKSNELALHVWTIDDESEMKYLAEIGVDGIMTDRPSVLSKVLRDLGCYFNQNKHHSVS